MKKAIFSLAVLFSAALTLEAQLQVQTESEREGAKAYNSGVEAFSAGKYDQSLPFFLLADSLLVRSKLIDRTKLRYTIGVAYLKSKKPGPALKMFEFVISADSTYPNVYLLSAQCAREDGELNKAEIYYCQALIRAENDQKPVILNHIGELLLKRGDLKGALKTYDEAIALSPIARYFLLRGQIYSRMADPLDHANNENFDFEKAINEGKITQEQMEKAIELREKALADFKDAAEDDSLAAQAQELIERTEIIIENNHMVISEIQYLKESE